MKATIAPDFEKALPEHTDAELAQLEKNVLADPKHINMPPVIVWTNHRNTIVDGHHQYRFRTKHGLTIKFQKREFGSRQDALREAYGIQFGRRNWNASQRAVAAAEFAKLLGNSSSDSTVILQSAAQTAGVSEKTAWDAKKVIEHSAAKIVEEVKAGNVAASDAAAIAELPKSVQVAALTAKRSGKAKTLRQAATDFDPASFKKPKPGKQKRVPADRKAAFLLFGKLVRALDKLGLSGDLDTELKAINQALKAS